MRFFAGYTQLESLVEEGLGESPNSESVALLTATVSTNLRQSDVALHRSLRGAIAASALFEFLSSASIAKIDVWGVTLAELGNFQRVLPALIGFLFFQAMLALATRRVYVDVLKQALRLLHRDTDVGSLVSLMHPYSTVGAESLLFGLHHGSLGIAASRLGFASVVAVLIGLPSFMAYSFARNWDQFGGFNWLWSAVVLVTIFFVVRGFLALGVLNKALEDSDVTD